MLLQIEHTTTYRYRQPVSFGQHRVMVRPMEGHDVQIRSSTLSIHPAHRIRWLQDVFNNSVALVVFQEPADHIRIHSKVVVEQFNTNPYDFILEPHATELPFTYEALECKDVAPYLEVRYPQDTEAVKQWLRPFLDLQGRARTLDFLTSIIRSFPLFFQYIRREEPGVQSPGETLNKRTGSCRDFSLLLMEAARHLGLASRFVSGYLCHVGDQAADPASDATHAWTEIYLPGAGWKGFDPTCGILAADLHVRVAVVRQPGQAVPVLGTFIGRPEDYQGMEVTVDACVLEK